MSIEHFPGGYIENDFIRTTNENGESVYVPVSQIPNLEQDLYPWGDAMVVEFDDENEGESDE